MVQASQVGPTTSDVPACPAGLIARHLHTLIPADHWGPDLLFWSCACQGERSIARLTMNGYNWAKMVRGLGSTCAALQLELAAACRS